MKTKASEHLRQFQLRILAWSNNYYIDRIAKLEKVLSKKPKVLQIDMVGVGEIPADAALRIRSVLLKRSAKTRIVTNAQSSLQNGSVLVWLLGDARIIRNDARLFFRRADLEETAVVKPDEPWKGDSPDYRDSYCVLEPEEGDYARVLELIGEYLPVNEMAGRLIGLPVLKQFGLVENEQLDQFLRFAFAEKTNPVKGCKRGEEHPSRTSKSSKGEKARK